MSIERRVAALELRVGFLGEQVARHEGLLEKHQDTKVSDLAFWERIVAFVVENRGILVIVAIPVLRTIVDILNLLINVLHRIPKLPDGHQW